MFGFSKRRSLEEIASEDFVLGAGVWAMRGKGPLRVVASEGGYDLQVGPAPLEMLNGAAWPGGPFEMSAGFAGDAQFERHSCAAQPGPFGILELPARFGLVSRWSWQNTKSSRALASYERKPLASALLETSGCVAPSNSPIGSEARAPASRAARTGSMHRTSCTNASFPIFQMFETGPIWIDSDETTWQETLAEEVARRGKSPGGRPCGPPLVFRGGEWSNAITALKVS